MIRQICMQVLYAECVSEYHPILYMVFYYILTIHRCWQYVGNPVWRNMRGDSCCGGSCPSLRAQKIAKQKPPNQTRSGSGGICPSPSTWTALTRTRKTAKKVRRGGVFLRSNGTAGVCRRRRFARSLSAAFSSLSLFLSLRTVRRLLSTCILRSDATCRCAESVVWMCVCVLLLFIVRLLYIPCYHDTHKS